MVDLDHIAVLVLIGKIVVVVGAFAVFGGRRVAALARRRILRRRAALWRLPRALCPVTRTFTVDCQIDVQIVEIVVAGAFRYVAIVQRPILGDV
jgi:hypothetical protein